MLQRDEELNTQLNKYIILKTFTMAVKVIIFLLTQASLNNKTELLGQVTSVLRKTKVVNSPNILKSQNKTFDYETWVREIPTNLKGRSIFYCYWKS